MPSPASPDTNQYRCEFCGRHFNSESELRDHSGTCEQAYRSGRADKEQEQPKAGREEGPDREWVSTP